MKRIDEYKSSMRAIERVLEGYYEGRFLNDIKNYVRELEVLSKTNEPDLLKAYTAGFFSSNCPHNGETVDKRDMEEEGYYSKEQYCFDSFKGWLDR